MIDKYLSRFSLLNIESKFKYDIFKRNIVDYDKKLKLNFSSGHPVKYELINYDKFDNIDNKIKYDLISSNKYEQIPMIKLFMVVYSVRSFIEYERRNNNYIFYFYLDHLNQRKKIKILENNKIISCDNKPLFINSNDEVDHVLFKVFIKICNIFKFNIKDINISDLIRICSSSNIKYLNMKKYNPIKDYFYIDSELNSKKNLSIKEMKRKISQDKWLSNNMFEIIMNKTVDPLGDYAKDIYEMYRLDMIIGITIGSNFLFIIDDMFVSELGELEFNMLNVFTGEFIKMKFGSLVKKIDKIVIKI